MTQAGATPNAKNREDYWPLLLAIVERKIELVKHLLGLGNIDLAQVDGRGHGVLYWACRRGTDIFTLVHDAVKKHPDYASMRQDAIHAAVAADNHAAFDSLAEPGLDWDAPSSDGWTLLHTARCYGLHSMEEKLLGQGATAYARPGSIKTPMAWHNTDKAVSLAIDEAAPTTVRVSGKSGLAIKCFPYQTDAHKPDVSEITHQLNGESYRADLIRAEWPLPGDEDWYFEVTVTKGYDDDDEDETQWFESQTGGSSNSVIC